MSEGLVILMLAMLYVWNVSLSIRVSQLSDQINELRAKARRS